MPGQPSLRDGLGNLAGLRVRTGLGDQRFRSDVHDDLVDVRVGHVGDLPGKQVPRHLHQRIGQASGRRAPGGLGPGVVARRGRGVLVIMQAVRVLEVPARRAQRLQHDRPVGGWQAHGHCP